jgi:hypothetical protein
MKRIATLAALAMTLASGRADPLAGRIAGAPVDCIDPSRLNGPDIVDADTILYRQSGKRIWVSGPVGQCPSLRTGDTLVVELYGGRLCRNDRFRTITPGISIPSGVCRFRAFVPYDRSTPSR